MSSICGIFHRDGHSVPPETIEAMTAALNHWQAESLGTWCNPSGTVALGYVKLSNTPESLNETLPYFHDASRLTITADARIDNRADLYRQLDIAAQEQNSIPDSHLILLAYRKWGRKCMKYLIGDFAFAIWDEKEKQLFCARDHLGNKPLFYFAAGDSFIFATEMKGIFKARNFPRMLSQHWIADALTLLVADNEYTPYTDIWRLPPAHCFLISPGEIKKETYWCFDPGKEIHFPAESDYVEALREKLTEAVRCRVRSAFPIGAELSGGLDSSAAAALAAGQAETRSFKFITFSHVLGEADQITSGLKKDEREFQDMLRRHARINHAYGLTAQDRGVIETLKKSLLVQDGPSHRVYGGLTDVLHEAAAREGVRTLLSGFGGDEVVSHQAGEYLDELAKKRAWQDLWQEYRGRPAPGQKYPIKALFIKMCGEYIPLLKTFYRHIRGGLRETRENSPARDLELFPLRPEFYQAAGIRQRLASIPRMPGGEDVRTSQYRRIMHTHVPVRLEYCSIAAAAHRLEYRYPLLDIRLLEFHLAVPSRLKRKDGYGRYLFRRAIEGIVPPEIQWRTDKTMAAIPSARHRLIRDAQAIESLIRRSKHNQAASYIDLEQMSKRLEQIVNMKSSPVQIRQGVFLNALKLLLFFDHTR